MCFSLLGLVSCGELDNYVTPDHTLTGTLTDALTGEPLITTDANFNFGLKEISFSEDAPQRTYPGRADGIYQNTKLFNATYEIELKNGGFVPPPIETIEVSGTTVKDYTVMPYMGIKNVSTSRLDSTLTVSWNIERYVDTEAFQNTTVWLSQYPQVSQLVKEKTINFGGLWDSEESAVLDSTYIATFEELDPAQTYYIKVSMRARSNPGNVPRHYNWTETMQID